MEATLTAPAVTLPAPPDLPAADQGGTALTSALPMLAGLGSMVMMAGMSGVGQTRTLVAGGFFLLSTALVIGTQLLRQRRQHLRRIDESRAAFLRHLEDARARIDEASEDQRRRLGRSHPPLETWLGSPTQVRGTTRIRLGTGTLPAECRVDVPAPADPDRADPFALRTLHGLAARATHVSGVPVTVDLTEWDEVVLTTEADAGNTHGRTPRGAAYRDPDEARRALVRQLVCQAAVSCAPDTLRVVLACAPDRVHHWEWLKWLPHHRSRADHDVAAGRRLRVGDATATAPEDDRSTLLVVDGEVDLGELGERAGTTVLRIPAATAPPPPPAPRRAVLRAATGDGDDLWLTPDGVTPCRAAVCGAALAEVVARRLDRAAGVSRAGDGPRLDDLPGILGVEDPRTWDPGSWWARPGPRDELRVPIGLDADGCPVHLDLKESARGGDGPHGLVVGATGSGKSELLRTLVLALAVQHSPEDLGMVLVDFKGGATFAGLGDLPHVAAVVTNLGDDLALVDRMADTLTGELVRRQEVLRAAGHASLDEHRRARRDGAALDPLPSLFVCIDEFSELLSARPDFIDVFVAIGRVGRSLGVHLLLASQRIEEGRLRGLETHLSYRIGLRTFSAAESRAAIGCPDAHTLPPVPGAGFLATGAGTPVRFTAAYVSGPAPSRTPVAAPHRRPLPWTLGPIPDPPGLVTPESSATATIDPATTVDVVVARTRTLPRTRDVWLPPLTRPTAVGRLFGDVSYSADLGVHSPSWRRRPGRRVPVGVVDRPREQRRDVWHLDLSGATGHCAVVGGPRSGRTTALHTLVTGLCLTATPTEVQVLLLDFGGGGLAPLTPLPHVVASAGRGEPMVRRVVEEATGLVDRREAWFREQGIDSFETYLERRAAGTADDGYGEVFVVVDGWGVLRADDHETEAALQRMAERGLTFGVHLVVATQRWSDLRASLRDQFGSRLELRLGDPVESTVDRRRAAGVPVAPGHGLVGEGLALLTAVPALDVPAGAATPSDPLAHLVAVVDRGWEGVRPRRLARLPDRVDLASLRTTAGDSDTLLLGHDGETAVALGPAAAPHLLVRGGPGSGRSTVLRTHLEELQRVYAPAAMQVVLVDPRGGLEGAVGGDHLLHHLVSRSQMRTRLGELATYLQRRLPGPDVTAEQLRARDWWRGAEVTVVVDDHDLVTAGGWQDCGLHLLAPLVPQAREVGLRVVVAQRSTTVGRPGDPLVQALLDLEAPSLDLTGGSPAGRATLTVRGAPPRSLRVARPLSGVRT